MCCRHAESTKERVMEAAAKAGKETTDQLGVKGRKAAGEADDMVETALAAVAAALLVSVLKTLLHCVLGGQRPGFLLGPSPFLFLLLQLVIASIVFVSTHRTANTKPAVEGGRKAAARRSVPRREAGTARCVTAPSQGKRQQHQQQPYRACRRRREGREHEDGPAEKEVGWEDGGGCAADELNARAEAFISAFRQHLKLDSISSNSRRGRRASRAASFRY